MIELKKRLFIVFALDHYNPLGAIRSLGEKCIRPVFIAVKHRADLGANSVYLSKLHKVNSVEEGYQVLLSEYGNEKEKPFLITCDDRTTGYLDTRYDEIKNRFIFFNAGQPNRISQYMDKNNILEIAKKHGLGVLETKVLRNGEVPRDLNYPIITKSISPNVGGWKSDVHICYNEKELESAYKIIKSPVVLAQKYIEKKNELCLDGFCANQGKDFFIGIASTYKYLIPGYYSPYMDVFEFKNERVFNSLKSMMKEIGFEGVFSIEFIVDQEDNLWFLEVNFRNSTWSYASTVAGMPLPYLWARAQHEGSVSDDMSVHFDDFEAMVEPIDYGKRVDTNKVTLAEWLADFKRAKCTYYFNNKDSGPNESIYKHWDSLK